MRSLRERNVTGGCWTGRYPLHLLTAVSLWLLASSATATAITLDSLQGMTTGIGPLSIEWTKVEGTGAVDLSQVELVMSSDANGLGFDLVPISDGLRADFDSVFDIKLEFTVSSTVPLVSVGNYLTAVTTGGYWAQAFETVLQDALVTATAFHSLAFSQPVGVDPLAAPLTQLDIVKTIIVNYDPGTTAAGDFGRIDLLGQRFEAVPEPGTGLLVSLGILGMSLGSRRSRGDRPALPQRRGVDASTL